jgi:L-asparaginase
MLQVRVLAFFRRAAAIRSAEPSRSTDLRGKILSELPRIAFIPYGGTISSVVTPGVGAQPTLDVGEMARSLSGMGEIARLAPQPSKHLASSQMTVDDLLDISRKVRAAISAGCSGAVVSQGTDTIEEIAFGLDLLWDGDEPVVVTGAMRNASLPSADGPANVLAAVRVAASAAARGLGALVVLNDEIHAARFVRKSSTSNLSTFRSSNTGPIGWMAEDDVRIVMRPSRRFQLRVPDAAAVPPVALLKMSLGDDGRLVPLLPSAGFAGCVFEGFGGGHLSAGAASTDVLESLLAAMPVVLASRAGSGEALRSTYMFQGSEIDLISRGVIYAGALDGPKARILLTLLLASGATRDQIREAFTEIGPLC